MNLAVIASEAKQSGGRLGHSMGDCFVAPLLAMTQLLLRRLAHRLGPIERRQ
jgi:hypothetical protein